MNETIAEDRGHTGEILTEAAHKRFIERTGKIKNCLSCAVYPCALWAAGVTGQPQDRRCGSWQAKEASHGQQQ